MFNILLFIGSRLKKSIQLLLSVSTQFCFHLLKYLADMTIEESQLAPPARASSSQDLTILEPLLASPECLICSSAHSF
jgi:hypothetical protein